MQYIEQGAEYSQLPNKNKIGNFRNSYQTYVHHYSSPDENKTAKSNIKLPLPTQKKAQRHRIPRRLAPLIFL